MQDKPGKQKFHYDETKDFEPVTKRDEASKKAIQLNGQETNNTMHEIEISCKSTEVVLEIVNFLNNRLMPAFSELFNCNRKVFFDCDKNLIN